MLAHSPICVENSSHQIVTIVSMTTTLNTVARMLTTPLVPQDFFDLINPLASSTDLRGRIEAIEPETASETARAATVRIRVGRGWRRHLAGQYVRLGVDIDGVRQWRTYSNHVFDHV